MNPSIFRNYDIRGIYNQDITNETAYTIGKSFGTYIGKDGNKKVIVGYDNRESSPVINENLIKGLLSTGVDVISLGLVTTPMYYYAKKKLELECGIMITASHNPKEYNGFKISFSSIGNAYGQDILDFRDFTARGIFNEGTGTLSTYDIKQEYLDLIKYSLDIGFRKVRVVVDCGNGTGSIIIKDILNMLGITYYPLYCDSDPTFPNHHPDPSVKDNMVALSEKVKELNYTLGIAVDGDADRIGLVDELGNIISADLIMDIFYRDLADKMDPKRAIFDVKCSKTLIDDLTRMGYEKLMYRTGSSYMNAKINNDEYVFGGEYSGHIWFNDDKWPGFDDGIYAGLKLIEILSNTDKSVSMLLKDLNLYFSTDELKIKVTDENKFKVVEKVKEYAIQKGYDIITIDGVRVEFLDGWALVRASNTGPDLTVRFEARTEERLIGIKQEFENVINDAIQNI